MKKVLFQRVQRFVCIPNPDNFPPGTPIEEMAAQTVAQDGIDDVFDEEDPEGVITYRIIED
jgi:hypothetical protein